MTAAAIIEMITVSVKLFSEERKRYYDNKIKDILRTIAENSGGGSYYDLDMEAKGKAEQSLLIEVEPLRQEWIKDIATL
jgi:hypothetical protein